MSNACHMYFKAKRYYQCTIFSTSWFRICPYPLDISRTPLPTCQVMSDKEKKRFVDMADKDKSRYEAEMRTYVPPPGGGGRRGKGKRKPKDPNAPKRALSAFFWFCNDERPALRAARPDSTVGDIAKLLGKKWAEVDETVKAKYEAMADKDRARYARVSDR